MRDVSGRFVTSVFFFFFDHATCDICLPFTISTVQPWTNQRAFKCKWRNIRETRKRGERTPHYYHYYCNDVKYYMGRVIWEMILCAQCANCICWLYQPLSSFIYECLFLLLSLWKRDVISMRVCTCFCAWRFTRSRHLEVELVRCGKSRHSRNVTYFSLINSHRNNVTFHEESTFGPST